MPFHSHQHNQPGPNPAKGALQAAGAVGLAVGAPSLQRLGVYYTSHFIPAPKIHFSILTVHCDS
jgi:hypothetical protein